MNALIIVDVQNDFCKGGALAVSGGETIVPGIKKIVDKFDLVVTTQDFHPQKHGSFASNNPGAKPFTMGTLGGRPQFMWPDHCVQNTAGVNLFDGLPKGEKTFQKGTNPAFDSYSAFFDDGGQSTGLLEYLKANRVENVFICGLATDYCIKFSVLDSCKQGFRTWVLTDLIKGVEMVAGDSQKALNEMEKAGATLVTSIEPIP